MMRMYPYDDESSFDDDEYLHVIRDFVDLRKRNRWRHSKSSSCFTALSYARPRCCNDEQ